VNNNKLHILFVLDKLNTNTKGTAPLRCRLTYLGNIGIFHKSKSLEHYTFQSEILNKVKDCYLFCCYTGLAYKEMFELKKQDLITKTDGTIWIYKKREKKD
jgi:hypothetical protein